jgi:hypothetical protein
MPGVWAGAGCPRHGIVPGTETDASQLERLVSRLGAYDARLPEPPGAQEARHRGMRLSKQLAYDFTEAFWTDMSTAATNAMNLHWLMTGSDLEAPKVMMTVSMWPHPPDARCGRVLEGLPAGLAAECAPPGARWHAHFIILNDFPSWEALLDG